jgi:hypothetical protein
MNFWPPPHYQIGGGDQKDRRFIAHEPTFDHPVGSANQGPFGRFLAHTYFRVRIRVVHGEDR